MELEIPGSGSVAEYAALTFPFYRKTLLSASPDGPAVAVGCRALGAPFGLALGYLGKDGTATILSLFVIRDARGRGIAAALMKRMEAELAHRGCTKLYVRYKMDGSSVPGVERILEKLGWEKPRLHLITCKVQGEDVHRMMQASWMKEHRLPPEFEVLLWRDASEEDRESAREAAESLCLLDGSPFLDRVVFDPLKFDPLNSLGLRHKGRTVGCMLTRQVSPGVMRYDNMFVREEFQRTGRGIVLVAEAIRLQYARDRDLPTVGGVWRSRAVNAPMIRFIRRRLGPYLTSVLETKESVNHLSANGDLFHEGGRDAEGLS